MSARIDTTRPPCDFAAFVKSAGQGKPPVLVLSYMGEDGDSHYVRVPLTGGLEVSGELVEAIQDAGRLEIRRSRERMREAKAAVRGETARRDGL